MIERLDHEQNGISNLFACSSPELVSQEQLVGEKVEALFQKLDNLSKSTSVHKHTH